MNNDLREKIRALRHKGQTYAEILKNLKIDIPKSTVSYVCRGVVVPSFYKNKIKKLNLVHIARAQKIAVKANQEKRRLYLESLRNRNQGLNKVLDKDVLKIALSMLYLGEGAKWRGSRGLKLGSSDPAIVSLFIQLLRLCYGINQENLHCRVQYRADQDINKLEKFWSRLTGIPIKNFYKTKPDPRTKGKITKNQQYRGVCVVHYGSTEIQLELEIIVEIIKEYLHGPVAQW